MSGNQANSLTPRGYADVAPVSEPKHIGVQGALKQLTEAVNHAQSVAYGLQTTLGISTPSGEATAAPQPTSLAAMLIDLASSLECANRSVNEAVDYLRS